jgi:molybdopterin-guanine dinucleotide biosynthesis protein A
VEHPAAPVLGVVLCGGASRRMGRAKSAIGDPPWAHRVAAVMAEAGCSPVRLLGEPPGEVAARELLASGSWELVPDARPGAGPGTAVADHLRALESAGTLPVRARVVVAACDLPDLSARDVRLLAESLQGGSAAYVLNGRPQLSLLALDTDAVRRIADTPVPEGISLRSLLGGAPLLVDPVDPGSVSDIDEP